MAETLKLEARSREKTSKGAVRSLRREGRVPAVIYGDKKSPILIDLSYKEVSKLYHTGTFLSHTLDIEVDGKKEHVIPRDVQLEPVRDFIIHIDFLRLGKNATITVAIPVHFVNEEASPGLKAGGVLNVVRHEVDLVCPASSIPEAIEIDLAGYEMGDSIHISSVKLPTKVEPAIADRDFTIATIAMPASVQSAESEEGAEEAEAAEEAPAAEEGGEDSSGSEE
ncbi:50S ribosomal protein L25/general stress protein Ctc [Parvibaculum sp.]|jgi:large subunit ribosomal protein L25|uniref:50S ribosomal protein L25/general stress protein Ctc n=1 Tax=Parvibaculum sp. TaxID=2024848 RepID=UPI000C8BDDB0|nr:50S ribosomal protein L25/general stress protein Ctc [Parvibaculum sp.]MAB13752.1 50S ribosomal protein L25/general stress protein Ctc [Parvibaculum sp.]